MKTNIKKESLLTKFSTNLLKNKWIVIGVFIVLIIASAICSTFVQKESDVISYLDNDTVTKQGLSALQKEFGIIGDFTIGISYLNESQVQEVLTEMQKLDSYKNYVNKAVWKGTFNELNRLDGIANPLPAGKLDTIREKLTNKFVIRSIDKNKNNVDTYLINIYFTTANSDDETIAAIDDFEKIIESKINEFIKNKAIVDAADETITISSLTNANQCYAFGGSAQNSRSLLKSSIGDMPKFVIAAVIAVFIILFLTTTSYLEPLVFLATLGISILLNMGTNIIAGIPIGKISSITASCSTILQLAVAMDYAIFLMHTYYEELRTTPDKTEAMRNALPKTIKSVVASSLTTVGGFIALFFMEFGIGYDLGFVLAKGVLLSLITVICLQPIIILFVDKLIKKTQHKWVITPRLKFMSKIITKKGVAIPIIAVCVAILIPACIFQSKVDLTFITVNAPKENPNVTETILDESSNMVILLAPFEMKEKEGVSGEYTPNYAPQYDFINRVKKIGLKKATQYDNKAKYYEYNGNDYKEIEISSSADFEAKKDILYVGDNTANVISDVFSLCTIFDAEDTAAVDASSGKVKNQIYQQLYANFVTDILKESTYDGKTIIVPNHDPSISRYALYTMTIDGPKEDQLSYNTFAQIQSAAKEAFKGKSYYITGNVVAAQELSTVTPKDYRLVSIISVAIIFLILLFTFKSPLLAAILVAVIETGIWTNLSISYFMGVQLHFMAYLIVTAIALGATVDYAILVTSKYLEEKKNGATGQAAIRSAIYRAAPGVLTSGSIFFVACLAVQIISTNIIVKQITELLSRNAIFSVILVFTFLPAILSIKERITRAISIKRGKGDPDEGKSNESIYSVSSKDLAKFAKEHNITPSEDLAEAVVIDTNAAIEDKQNNE